MDGNISCKGCSKEPQERINIMRFVNRMDEHFRRNDLEGAVATVEFWQAEAQRLHDTAALLSVLNEELGLFRRLKDEEKALKAIELALNILTQKIPNTVSRVPQYL